MKYQVTVLKTWTSFKRKQLLPLTIVLEMVNVLFWFRFYKQNRITRVKYIFRKKECFARKVMAWKSVD
jgi:hypothetical protein